MTGLSLTTSQAIVHLRAIQSTLNFDISAINQCFSSAHLKPHAWAQVLCLQGKKERQCIDALIRLHHLTAVISSFMIYD